MAFFPSHLRLAGAALGAMVAVTPLCSGACGSTACFVYTQAQYAATNGCPSQAHALASFSSPSCPGAVTAVDGEGSFDGAYCCYTVTQQDENNVGLCGFGGNGGGFGGNGGGGGGFGGNGGGGFGASGVGGNNCAAEGDPCAISDNCCASLICNATHQCAPSGTGAFGGAGGSVNCVSCSDEVNAFGATASQLCASSAPLWSALTTCACAGGTCNAACDQSFCAGIGSDAGCLTCLTSTTTGCGQAFDACDSN